MAVTSDNFRKTAETTQAVKEKLASTVSQAKEGKLQIGAVIRLVALIITWINQIAVTFGGYSIPYVSDSVIYLISTTITIIATAVVYWMNNSWTVNAKTADAILEALDSSDITADDVVDAVCDVIDSGIDGSGSSDSEDE
jgi:SPP1 family holin